MKRVNRPLSKTPEARIIGNLIIGLPLGIIVTIAFLFPRLAIWSRGTPIIAFLCIAMLIYMLLLTKNKKLAIDENLKKLLVLFGIFIFTYTLMFMLNGSFFTDIEFLVSTATWIFWVLFLVIFAQLNFSAFRIFAKTFLILYPLIIILAWVLLFLNTNDIFFMRFKYTTLDLPLIKYTPFSNPNYLARTILLILPCFCFFYLTSFMDNKISWHLFFAIAVLLMIVITTLSRSNFISVFIVLFGIISFRDMISNGRYRLNFKKNLIVVFSLLAILILLSPSLKSRLSTFTDLYYKTTQVENISDMKMKGVSGRLKTWYASFKTIEDRPITGVGATKSLKYQKKYGSIRNKNNSSSEIVKVHGGFLQIAVFGGIITFLIFLVFYLYFIQVSLCKFRTSPNLYPNKIAAMCLTLLFIIIMLMNIGCDAFGYPLTWMSIGLLCGFMFKNSALKSQSNF